MNRAQEIAQRVVSGETMASIGRDLNLSRERVRQIVHQEYRRMTELKKVHPLFNDYGVTILKNIRISYGLNLKDVCEKIKISLPSLSQIENGQMTSLKKARILAEFYRLPIGELFVIPNLNTADGKDDLTDTEGS